jgi:hypothetical protein
LIAPVLKFLNTELLPARRITLMLDTPIWRGQGFLESVMHFVP